MLRIWQWLKTLVMPASGKHAHPEETRDFWADERREEVDWLPDDDFPIVCPNGCPEGHLGRHKFSCPTLRETRAERALTDEYEAALVRPYIGKRRTNV